jgi:hypothetical protein
MRLLGANRKLLALGIASVSAVAALLVLGSGLRDAPQPRQARRVPHFRSFDRDLFKTSLAKVADGGEPGARDGAEQESYDNRAYPALVIDPAQQLAAAAAAAAINRRPGGKSANWQELGPAGVPASGLVASESTGGSVGVLFAGRTTAIAISPACHANDCKIFIGAAGGGVWEADNALAAQPNWRPSGNGIPSNAIGSIAFDPTDRFGRTLYVGTGEPNGSSDSEAGVGLYKSTDFGRSWTLVPGSVAASAPCASGAGSCPVAVGRSIGAVAIDPADPEHIFIGIDVARHGSSSVNGGRFTPPRTARVGLYESTDGGASFVPAFLPTSQDSVNPANPTGGDFFRGGASDVELYRSSNETHVYAAFFDYGVYRRSVTLDGDNAFHQIFNSAGGGTVANSPTSRTEFSLAPDKARLRIYVGDTGNGATADFFRVDDANVAAGLLATGGTNPGWTKLSNPANGTPGFASRNYCATQCSYDMPVYSPPGAPDVVYIGGAMQYSEIGGRSNGRAVQRSEDGGVNFTDMTIDRQGVSLHPDQHVIAATPLDPDVVFIGNDGGVWRLNGSFADLSGDCAARPVTGNNLVDCTAWLSKVPATISAINGGLGTLQYQSLSISAQDPLNQIMGGTQDNGTHAFFSKSGGTGKGSSNWFVTIFGDGGQSGISASNARKRFHTFFDAQIDMNFRAADELGWNWVSDTFFGPSGAGQFEGRSFYIPVVFDPIVDGSVFTGLQHVWRTQDDNGGQAFLEANCNEFFGTFAAPCGNWVAIGQDLAGAGFGADKVTGPAGYVVAVERAAGDRQTLWAGLRRGRVFVTSNAGNANAAAVTFYRIDSAATPERFVSGIAVDPGNANHAYISFSGYNAYAAGAGTAPGHVFEVTYNPATHTATWVNLDYNLGDQPITDIALDANTGDLFVSTDFGVNVLRASNTAWVPAAGSLPPVAVYGLTIDSNARVLYAATHGRGAWKLDLR